MNLSGYELDPALASAVTKMVAQQLSAAGVSVAAGGAAGQVLAKASNLDFDTYWTTAALGGGSSSASLNIDGGNSSSTYTGANLIDGGSA